MRIALLGLIAVFALSGCKKTTTGGDDGGSVIDSGSIDAATTTDSSVTSDAGATTDAAVVTDADTGTDASSSADAYVGNDAWVAEDATVSSDASTDDASVSDDAATADSGTNETLSLGDRCGDTSAMCGADLSCCYPGGVRGLHNMCETTCNTTGCVDGCHLYP